MSSNNAITPSCVRLLAALAALGAFGAYADEAVEWTSSTSWSQSSGAFSFGELFGDGTEYLKINSANTEDKVVFSAYGDDYGLTMKRFYEI